MKKIVNQNHREGSDKATILVVDDTPENITLLRGVLEHDYVVKPTIRGRQALRLARREPKPDLILLDIMMPEMDGYEVCQQLKADVTTQDIPVIFVTAKVDIDDELQGLAVGAVDYITKPINPAIVLARLKTHLSLKQAQQQLSHKNATLQKVNEVLTHEREMVENIVLKMRSAQQFDATDLNYLISSVEETNGDVLLSAYDGSGRQVVLVGDFTGHGLPAAIGGPLVSYIFYTMVSKCCTITELVEEINRVLCRQLPTNVFMVACILAVSANRQQMTLLNAAMPSPLLVRDGKVVQCFDSKRLPLGIVEDEVCHSTLVTLNTEPQDRLYLFSDGLIEATSRSGEMFAMQRVERLLSKVQSGISQLPEVLEALDHFCDSQAYDDDITLVEVAF